MNLTRFKKSVISSFSMIRNDMEIVKESFGKAKSDIIDIREKLAEWTRFFDLRQRETAIEVKELKERVKMLEEELVLRREN